MIAHRHSWIAAEGWPLVIAAALVTLASYQLAGMAGAVAPALILALLILLFRDPRRDVPPNPRGVVAPVDGKILAVEKTRDAPLAGDWVSVVIRPNPFGAYTVRAPIEGTVCNLSAGSAPVPVVRPVTGLWIRSEEEDDVILTFPSEDSRWLPKTFVRYGERVGQGYRFAYLRLARRAEVILPAGAGLAISPGDTVKAGTSLLAELQPV